MIVFSVILGAKSCQRDSRRLVYSSRRRSQLPSSPSTTYGAKGHQNAECLPAGAYEGSKTLLQDPFPAGIEGKPPAAISDIDRWSSSALFTPKVMLKALAT